MYDFLGLKGKRIVVTGGLGLIGKSIVENFLMAASDVIIIDVDDKVANELLKKWSVGNLFYESFDLTKLSLISNFISNLEKKNGTIDVWINNAYPRTSDWGNKLEDVCIDSWQKNIDMQLNSYCICSNEIAKRMAQRNSGVIINVSSIYGIVAPDFSIYEGTQSTSPAAYSAIKGGIIAYSKYLASYFGIHNVRVNVVAPGGVVNNQSEGFISKYSKKTLLRRMAKPEEIAKPILFLSSEAASYITGEVLLVDGGWTTI